MRSIRCALFRIHLITAVKQAETWHFIKELRTWSVTAMKLPHNVFLPKNFDCGFS